jgi:tetratricopeptide (TPR) repeat protein
MFDPPPHSPLITPDLRRRLQQRYEEAVRLMAQRPGDSARVHELLAECLRADPGNILYLDALLANLRKWQPKRQWSWSPGWLTGRKTPTSADVFDNALDALRRNPGDAAALRRLATAAGEHDLGEVEVRYWQAAVECAAQEPENIRGLARALTRQGRFDEAREQWQKLVTALADPEAAQAVSDLDQPSADDELHSPDKLPKEAQTDAAAVVMVAQGLLRSGKLVAAQRVLTQAQAACGGDLSVRRQLEELQLARSEHRIELARRRALSDADPQAQALVARLEAEHRRLEIEIFHLRAERHPDDSSLRLNLGRKLKQAGNYSGAIQRLEEARGDGAIESEALLELGECWQHLRQFGKALDFYHRAIAGSAPRPLLAALYRLGVLSAAMGQLGEARDALSRLISIDPGYKDARERLDKLP